MKKILDLPIFKPSISFMTLVVTILLVCVLWILGLFVVESNRHTTGIAPLHATVESDFMSLSVESVREDSVGVVPFTPHEGNTFIIPTLIIKNLSTTTRDLIPSLTLYIKDIEGNIYNMALAPVIGEQFGGPVLPGDSVRQEIAFEVKKGAKNPVLYFEVAGVVLRESLENYSGLFR